MAGEEKKSGKMEQGTRSYTNRKLKHSQLSSPSSLYIFPSFCVFYSSSNSDIYFSSLSLSPRVGEIFSFLNYPSQRCCVLTFDINPGASIKDFFYDELAVWRGGYLISSPAHNNTSKVIVCTISLFASRIYHIRRQSQFQAIARGWRLGQNAAPSLLTRAEL